jgi:hypothetical protein
MRRFVIGLLILVSALTLVLASTSLWTRRNVVNTQVFVSNVQTMVDRPEVEARVTEQVTATVMANPQVQDAIDAAAGVLPPRLQQFRPTVENGIRSLISAGVQRLLTSDPFRPLTSAALTTAHDQLVNGQPVQFTLGQAKARVPDSLRGGVAGQVLALLPDDVGVTILTPADSPQIYNAIDLLKSVWWWLGLVALGTLAGALSMSRRRRATLRAWAVTTTVLTLLVLLALRVSRGLLLPRVRPENRDAVGSIYDVLAGSLRSWTLWLLGIVLVVLVVTILWGRLGLVAGVRRGVASAREQLRVRSEQARAARAVGGEGGGDGATVAAAAGGDSWTRRVTVWTQGFADGLDLPARTARLGGYVREHESVARWSGIAVGALVLLFWPGPTLSVLIWIVALVALYLWALAWLQSRAPVVAPTVPAGTEMPTGSPDGLVGPDGQAGVVPQPRPTPPSETAVEPLVPPGLTPEAITTLNDRLDLLDRLGAARAAGVLSDDEFLREKGRLLDA